MYTVYTWIYTSSLATCNRSRNIKRRTHEHTHTHKIHIEIYEKIYVFISSFDHEMRNILHFQWIQYMARTNRGNNSYLIFVLCDIQLCRIKLNCCCCFFISFSLLLLLLGFWSIYIFDVRWIFGTRGILWI